MAKFRVPDKSASADRRRRALVVPPAAFMARLPADLSSVAFMAIAINADPF
jgi:hypothetical protein